MENKIIIFVSGNGSNMENIVTYFQSVNSNTSFKVYSNKSDCGAIPRAKKLGLPVFTFTKADLASGVVKNELALDNPKLIVLAGFLLKIPASLTTTYNNRIVNIHPSLLPKYGGKGMYGKHVHQAVIANKEKQSGITIHYVNEHYDEGNIVAQFTCSLEELETVDSLTKKIHQLEKEHFPKTIHQLIFKK